MLLTEQQSDRFFSVYLPLLFFSINEIQNVELEEFFEAGPELQIPARDLLMEHRELVDHYIREISALGPVEEEKISLLEEIKQARFSDFIVVESGGLVYYVDYRKNNRIYEITGLASDPREMYPVFPCRARSALMQLDGRIISDGLVVCQPVKFPKNAVKAIMRDFEAEFEEKIKFSLR